MGGTDSFTIIGTSGIGKSSAISRAIALITENQIIEVENPYTKIIPCICVQCPFDSSVKGLLLEVLRKVDEAIDSNYYQNALRASATTDMLIGSVSQAALNHIGLLVVDEIQNVCNSKHGKSLVGMLTQLINNSGISICMVGTPESTVFFEQTMQLAQRSLILCLRVLRYSSQELSASPSSDGLPSEAAALNKSLPLMWGGPVIDDVETVGTVLRRDAGAGEEDGVGYIVMRKYSCKQLKFSCR